MPPRIPPSALSPTTASRLRPPRGRQLIPAAGTRSFFPSPHRYLTTLESGSTGAQGQQKRRHRPVISYLTNLRERTAVTIRGKEKKLSGILITLILSTGGLIYLIPPLDEASRAKAKDKRRRKSKTGGGDASAAWFSLSDIIDDLVAITDIEWATFAKNIVSLVLPEWTKTIPDKLRKLQAEFSMAPGSLADDIWKEAQDPSANPEIQYKAYVRIGDELCKDEKEFLRRRKKVMSVALPGYIGIPEHEVHPDDVPIIALCGSGGGLRALTAGAGAMLATEEDGLFDCATYTSGVSGSCWLQMLYNSTISNASFEAVIDHIKARAGVHFAYPPVALSSTITPPTNKLLLAGMVEKLRGDPNADWGLVDVYGVLLAARFLVPRGEVGVDVKNFKLSNQKSFMQFGERPLPIYSIVRHEIPGLDGTTEYNDVELLQEKLKDPDTPARERKALKKEGEWFQWYELTPFEFFCADFSAGIPTWALGRRFEAGRSIPSSSTPGSDSIGPQYHHLPESRTPLLMGIFGSAMCATLRHYYDEIRPLVRRLAPFSRIDEAITRRNEELSKVHPIDPATIPNFGYGMEVEGEGERKVGTKRGGKLPEGTPESITRNRYIQLMDAGMSNNLPIYPLLREGRGVDIIIAFDSSADVRVDDWLKVADGWAREKGVKGWPVGIGWPTVEGSSAMGLGIKKEMGKLREATAREQAARTIGMMLGGVKKEQKNSWSSAVISDKVTEDHAFLYPPQPEKGELGYCNIWVGNAKVTTSKTSSSSTAAAAASLKPLTPRTFHSQLSSPDAGLTVIYLPFLPNPSVPLNPATADFLSTWNFVYTPEQVDSVVDLAGANFREGQKKIRMVVRAVYERKRTARLKREEEGRFWEWRRRLRKGETGLRGDLFS